MENKQCFECGSVEDIHDHHVVPRSMGGTKTIPLCKTCHGLVHSKKMTSISTLTKKAMMEMKEKGLYTGGRHPYGKSLVDGKLIDNPYEQAVMDYAKELRNRGLSLRKCEEIMYIKGFRTRNGNTIRYSQIARWSA